jgi:glycosyltransferase involved in cell wall biosynthesis
MTGRPLRVLHVVGRMDRGGVETWLMHVLRRVDRSRFHFDFLVHTDRAASYDAEICAGGGQIIPLPSPTPGLNYARRFRAAIRRQGTYDIVHSHVHHFSGIVARAAHKAGIPVRIAHSHTDTSVLQGTASVARRAYLRLTEALIDRYATVRLAASEQAGTSLFSPSRFPRERWQVLHYGIDVEPFATSVDRRAVRAEFGLSEEQLVIGHVGNLHRAKNHAFLIEIFAAIARRDPRAALLLVGDGPLRDRIKRMIADLDLTPRVVFAGQRPDVPRVLLGAIDLVAFPSLFEGLPLAIIEAQAAGLPVVLSDRVSEEVDVVPQLIRRLDIEQNPEEWATTCLQLRSLRLRESARRLVADSDLNISRSVLNLQQVYEAAVAELPFGRQHAA